MITSLEVLAEFMGADSPMECSLSRRLYKDTTCGAWLKVIDDDPDVNVRAGVLIGSIVEGTEACTMSRSLTFPFSADDYQEAVRAVEEEAQEIWDSTHGCDDCGMDGAINPECKTCKGEGTIL
jgi:hypothetical protein